MTSGAPEPPVRLAHLLPGPVAYVFGGGGAHGAVQLGMVQALAGTDLRPELVVGTSVGSLNGVMVAADPVRAATTLSEIWPRIDRTKVFPGHVVTRALSAYGGRPWLFDPGPLAELIAEYVPVSLIERLALPFVAVATDLDAGVAVEMDAGDVRSALMASSAIPGVFPWVERHGLRLVDGGLVANIPVRQAVERGARSVVILDCGSYGVAERRSDSLIGVIVQALTIATRQQIVADLEVARDVTVVYLPAPGSIRSTLFDFEHTEALAAAAYADSRQMLEVLALHRDPLGPGLYGEPPAAATHPSVRDLLVW